jgi:hypothetical protein
MLRTTIGTTAGRAVVVALLAAPLACLSAAGNAYASYPGGDRRLAFGMVDPSGNPDVYSVLPDGHGLRRLTTQPTFDACPARPSISLQPPSGTVPHAPSSNTPPL